MKGINEVKISDINLKSFEINDKLHPKIWINNQLNSRVRLKLLDIADDFINTLSISWVKPIDIVLTGSMANYNWSKWSDIDIHIIMDYSKIYDKTEFVEDYLSCKRTLWADAHANLKIYGFPIEVYVEDENSRAISSGVYSLEKNKWIKEPKDIQDYELNSSFIKRKAAKILTEIDNIEKKIKKEKDNHKIVVLGKQCKNVFNKLKKIRKNGLASSKGEMSSGNIIWKICRRMGYLDKIWSIINDVYNKANTID